MDIAALTTFDYPHVASMIKALYSEDCDGLSSMTDIKIEATFRQIKPGDNGFWIDVFRVNNTVIGYAMIYTFWSNEFGGRILNIDELYILETHRGNGYGSRYLRYLEEYHAGYAGLSLEVVKANRGAFALYERHGFKVYDRFYLKKLR